MDIDTEHYRIASGSDHEPSESVSDQSVPSHHRITNGYEVCIHTCTGLTCVSRKTKTILWNKEGHAVRKHAANKNMHPQCGRGFFSNCPGRECLGQTKILSFGGRDATEEEVALYIGVGIDTPRVDTDMTDEYGTPPMVLGPSTGDSHTTADRHFKLIYIPDAAMRIYSKEKALNDLGFIPTVLSELEYEPLQHLNGSIHVVSKFKARNSNIWSMKVVMQEWVSALMV
jgi:hypothetical protein